MKYSPGVAGPGAASRPLHSAPPSSAACPGECDGAVLCPMPEHPSSSSLCLQPAQLPAPAVQPLLSHQRYQQVQLGLLPDCSCHSQCTALSVLALLQRPLGHTGQQTGVSSIICSLTCKNRGQTALRNLCHLPCSLPRHKGGADRSCFVPPVSRLPCYPLHNQGKHQTDGLGPAGLSGRKC